MLRSMLKVMAATAAFALVHSALASRTAKRAAAGAFGERNFDGLYRIFYISQSVVTFGTLTAYICKLPNRELYHVKGPLRWVLRAGQVLAGGQAFAAARQVGIRRITGLESLTCWLADCPVPAVPEAQGPALDDEGLVNSSGPFAWSRHPLNFAPLPILWLWPRMTTSLFAFNTACTIYLVVGSFHEEARLERAYGEKYEIYRSSGIPFYVPSPRAGGKERMSTLIRSYALTDAS